MSTWIRYMDSLSLVRMKQYGRCRPANMFAFWTRMYKGRRVEKGTALGENAHTI